jgi:hypothetical protein
MHQKKYQKMMEPILEEKVQPVQDNNEDCSIDMVDYESSDNEEVLQEEQEVGEHIQGAILALSAPSLEHEHTDVVIPVDGSQPEAEKLQEDMQEGLTHEDLQGNSSGDEGRMEIRVREPVQPTRVSTRIAGHPQAASRLVDGTRTQKARDASGTNLNSFNSFAALDDDDIYSRALEMGVNPDTFTLEKSIILKILR